jgi:tRNA A37 threonylcarbamoyladenosine dehydratase
MIDTSFARAARVLPKQHGSVKFYLVGAGGTGSFAAHAVARLAYELNLRGNRRNSSSLTRTAWSASNIPRSNFCHAEIGRFKAQTLAERLTLAWGLEVAHVNESFDAEEHFKKIAAGISKFAFSSAALTTISPDAKFTAPCANPKDTTRTRPTPGGLTAGTANLPVRF